MRENIRIIFLAAIVISLLTVNLSDGTESSLFEPDGFVVQRDIGYKLGYIAGFVNTRSEILSDYFDITSQLIKALKREKAISATFTNKELERIRNEIGKQVVMSKSFDNIPFLQLAAGVDKFYEDSANMKIALPDALEVVKLRVRGGKENYIQCQIEYYRMKSSQANYDKQISKIQECSKLLK